ncbi:MAG: nucleoside kinase [Verrucomicrobia bacterium]|nr:nucleoside kinase [Verrucomicrobiota bacterium]
MMKPSNEFCQSAVPRPTVEVLLPDGRILCGPRNRPIGDFLKSLPEWSQHDPIMGAVINGELRELTHPVELDSRVQLVKMSDPDGSGIYRRSITFLLEAAFEDTFPTADISIDHSLSSGGFYCSVINRGPLGKEELAAVEARMKDLVKADLPFERQVVPLQAAIDYFQSKGQDEKVQLLKFRRKDTLVLYKLRDRCDYHHGFMVPSTGCLHWFALTRMGDGFALRFPRRQAPNELPPLPDSKKLLATFREYNDWLVRLGIDSVGALNTAIQAKRVSELILISEALHEHRIAEIASLVMARSKEARIVLVAGPSSSGKTTFSKRLTVQLLAQGISPCPLELDNYFLDREHTPKDEYGAYDFESLGALDTGRLQADLQQLIAGEEVQLPRFNFPLGHSEPGEVVKLEKDQLVILEGIHGMNPGLLPGLSRRQTTRIYVSCLTQLNLDRHNRIPTTDTRLLRRIIRDARDRGYTAQQTIGHWEAVRRGEKKHIFPYQENADELFNSALVYELSAIRLMAEPLLRQVVFGTPEYIEAKRLLSFLQWFLPIGEELIPDNSLLREFIGGSILQGFTLWKNGKHNGGYGSTGTLSELNC